MRSLLQQCDTVVEGRDLVSTQLWRLAVGARTVHSQHIYLRELSLMLLGTAGTASARGPLSAYECPFTMITVELPQLIS